MASFAGCIKCAPPSPTFPRSMIVNKALPSPSHTRRPTTQTRGLADRSQTSQVVMQPESDAVQFLRRQRRCQGFHRRSHLAPSIAERPRDIGRHAPYGRRLAIILGQQRAVVRRKTGTSRRPVGPSVARFGVRGCRRRTLFYRLLYLFDDGDAQSLARVLNPVSNLPVPSPSTGPAATPPWLVVAISNSLWRRPAVLLPLQSHLVASRGAARSARKRYSTGKMPFRFQAHPPLSPAAAGRTSWVSSSRP